MKKFNISKTYPWQGEITDKVAEVMRMFGLTVERLTKDAVEHKCSFQVDAGDIVYITGPSGSGKSVLLRELEQAVPDCERANLDRIELPADKTVIDCIAGDFLAALRLLSIAGLNDVFCVLNQPARLSDGQKYRFRLAMALAGGKKFVFADEFCTNLDRISASVVAYNVRRFAKKHGVTFILASSHQDILADLQPDVIVTKELSGPTEIIYKNGNAR